MDEQDVPLWTAFRSYLRTPRFTPEDKKPPVKATLCALPVASFLSINVWVLAFAFAAVIFTGLHMPDILGWALGLIFAVPCAAMTWAIFIRCIEVEASVAN
ncbi:hypothetical protein [Pelagibacterium montanilacus]|uniref:hypothetical protein n=1 Tax=Pelagibacterium montanilacus TaxID=2185280 RepID=UPI000F8E93A0|nr:hypothetical protein [Pelagibacterium montanilacus]